MGKRYFGTDGIRGRVGEAPITPDFILKLGWAAGNALAGNGLKKVLIGKDTRISGYMFESALEAGLSAAGLNSALTGPIPTPAIAYLTRTLRACAGIVISASHNPYYDNGCKFFSHAGGKLEDAIEQKIEYFLHQPMSAVAGDKLGKAERVHDALGRYIEFCKATLPFSFNFSGIKLVIDCANGAAYLAAPAVFEELGAKVVVINDEPDGLNINLNCGSTYPKALQKAVKREGADLGIAFDGDGDRVLMVDDCGEIVEGDELIYIMACDRVRRGEQLKTIVGTVMSNYGLQLALQALGLDLARVKVGDRHILAYLQENDLVLGGENSGHIICLDKSTTGDGIVSALQVLASIVMTGKPLRELKSGMQKYPQCIVNVPLAQSVDIDKHEAVRLAVQKVESALGRSGRVLLRPSGTEPVVRVMVEGDNASQVQTLAQDLASAVRQAVRIH